jgi:hypothetical protein
MAILALVVAGATACSNSGGKSSTSTSTTASTAASTSTTVATDAHKSAFCSADITLDQAGSNASSATDLITALKADHPALTTFAADAPAGQVGTEAKALVNAVNASIASNDPTALEQVPSNYGGDVDTYCGVDGNGDPLPAFFNQGKGSQFCDAIVQIDAGTNAAQSADDVLTFFKAHQNLVTQAGANLTGLPSPINTEAQALVAAAKQALAANNSDALNSDDIQSDAVDASLYCGDNQ